MNLLPHLRTKAAAIRRAEQRPQMPDHLHEYMRRSRRSLMEMLASVQANRQSHISGHRGPASELGPFDDKADAKISNILRSLRLKDEDITYNTYLQKVGYAK